jgi:hypothetical protein
MGNNFWNGGVSVDWCATSGCPTLEAFKKYYQKLSEHRRALSVVAVVTNAKANGSEILRDVTGAVSSAAPDYFCATNTRNQQLKTATRPLGTGCCGVEEL